MAELSERVRGLERYPNRAQVSAFKDKPTANAFMKTLREKYNLEDLIAPWEAKIESGGGKEFSEGPNGLKELKKTVWNKIHSYQADIAEDAQKHGEPLSKPAPWKFMLKPVAGDGSLGVVELNSDLSEAEINKLLEHHWEELQATRTRKSVLQEFVGEIELGYHGYKNGPHIHHELTIKELHGSKEIAHIDRGYRNWQSRRWEKAIFPVMEKVFEELGIDIGHLNADIRVGKWSRKFCPVDLQLRSGFGHPEMKNAVYGTDAQIKKPLRGRDVEQLYVALGLNMGEEEVRDASNELRRISRKPQRAAIAATIIPEGGYFLLSNVTDARLEAARNMPGIIDISIPDVKAGDHIPEIESLLTTEGHIFIEACGKDEAEARRNACNALAIAGVAIIRPDDNPSATDKISPFYNLVAGKTRDFYGGQEIAPLMITAKGATDSETAYIVHAMNHGIAGSVKDKKLRRAIEMLSESLATHIESQRGLEEEISLIEEKNAVPETKEFVAAAAYIKAIAAGFSETERTSPKWNKVTPSYTLVEPRQPMVGTRWHNGAKGPEEMFKAKEDRIARRRKTQAVKPKPRASSAHNPLA